uniref:Beta-lactamase domain-containing protein n=1 Tax=Cyanothece sp. (strain PCC 7425 / ATCC 29141) TaxID=395961 RepID=B8HX50_CYAP4
MQNHQLSVRFWGVRGSIACPGPHTVRYGGNTPCVELQIGQQRLIFDGGTGLRVLGKHLLSCMPLEAHLFFSHTHWDHIQGFPFFEPAFKEGNCFHIYGAIDRGGKSIQQRLHDQMLHPNFPVPLQIMRGNLKFYDLAIGQSVLLDDVLVETAPLNHPGGSIGYRVNWKGLAVSYITDTEHFSDRLDEQVLWLARSADIMIYDATYTDEEYHAVQGSKVGWGHSTWQEATKLARAAGVKQLILFHHDPDHNDDFLDRVERQAKRAFANSFLAREGLVIQLQPQSGQSGETDLEQNGKGEDSTLYPERDQCNFPRSVVPMPQ